VKSLVSKILCRDHNTALSELDGAAKTAFNTMRAARALGFKRHAFGQSKKKWKQKRFEIEGSRLERWFMKTAINLTVAYPGETRWEWGDKPANDPPLELIRATFGLIPVVAPLGLYVAVSPGEHLPVGKDFSFQSVHVGNRLTTAVFIFHDLRFALYVGVAKPDLRWNGTQAVRHMPEFRFSQGKHPSYSLDFTWTNGA
jgi:hypothetical protein